MHQHQCQHLLYGDTFTPRQGHKNVGTRKDTYAQARAHGALWPRTRLAPVNQQNDHHRCKPHKKPWEPVPRVVARAGFECELEYARFIDAVGRVRARGYAGGGVGADTRETHNTDTQR